MTQEIPNTYYRVTAKALILDESKKRFLVGKNEHGKWLLLGGGLEYGETVEQCLGRELKEETGLEIVTMNPSPAYVIPGQRDDGKWAIDMVHEVIVRDLDVFRPSPECVEIRFVSVAEAKELVSFKALQRFAQAFDPTAHRGLRKKRMDPSE